MSESKELPDLCRICLLRTETMHLFNQIDRKVIDSLNFSLNFKVMETFTALTNLCEKCKRILDGFSSLIQTAKETQNNLENWHDNHLKNDVVSNEEDLIEYPLELDPDEVAEKETPTLKRTEFTYDDIMLSIKDAESISYDNLKCISCSFVGISIKALISHMSIVHRDFKGKWCPVCNNLFDDLKRHREIHNKGDLTCRFCSKRFTVNKYLIQHLLSHTNLTKITRSNGNKVKKERESAGNCKLCNICGKQFSNSSKLLTHLRSHSNEAPFVCTICNKKLKTSSHLRQHENVHKQFRPYVCNICDKSFNQSSTLRTHLKLHGAKAERCSICDKTFCRISDLKIHLRTHTGEKPFRCHVCDSAFVQRSHLTEHEKSHLDAKPYKCSYCEKSFAQRSTLKSHIDIHLGVKSYRCDFCPYAARQSYVLKTHMRQHTT